MSNQDQLFNSYDDPIPGLRGGIEVFPVEHEGKSYIYFHDTLGYATPHFALEREAAQILTLFDGERSVMDLTEYFSEDVSAVKFLEYIRFLDKQRLLYSSFFKSYAEQVEDKFEQSEVRPPSSTGESYPEDEQELIELLDEAFDQHKAADEGSIDPERIRALYAPHIDPQVGMETYVRAFESIRSLKPKRVVIIATSHYAGLYPDHYSGSPFIVTDKTFELPHGSITSDQAGVESLLEHRGEFGVSGNDRAHRMEHSVELHLLFLRYIWDHDFDVLPILVDGFHELYQEEASEAKQKISNLSTYLSKQYGKDEDTLFLISGDLSHVGRKFGDEQPAREMFDEVKEIDEKFMALATQTRREDMFDLMMDSNNAYRICGFPPLYTFLGIMDNIEGHRIDYDLWDESERESAVSYGAIAFTGE